MDPCQFRCSTWVTLKGGTRGPDFFSGGSRYAYARTIWPRTTKFGMATYWEGRVSRSQPRPCTKGRTSAFPKFLNFLHTPTRYGMSNSNHILHGYHTRRQENFTLSRGLKVKTGRLSNSALRCPSPLGWNWKKWMKRTRIPRVDKNLNKQIKK